MNKDEFFKALGQNKFLEGLPEQVKEWSEAFQIRNNGKGYYIAWKGTTIPVKDETLIELQFTDWSVCRNHLEKNWRRYLDEEFEREVLKKED